MVITLWPGVHVTPPLDVAVDWPGVDVDGSFGSSAGTRVCTALASFLHKLLHIEKKKHDEMW